MLIKIHAQDKGALLILISCGTLGEQSVCVEDQAIMICSPMMETTEMIRSTDSREIKNIQMATTMCPGLRLWFRHQETCICLNIGKGLFLIIHLSAVKF